MNEKGRCESRYSNELQCYKDAGHEGVHITAMGSRWADGSLPTENPVDSEITGLTTALAEIRDSLRVRNGLLQERLDDSGLPETRGLDGESSRAMGHLILAWNIFLKAGVQHPDDIDEFRHAIHVCQNILLSMGFTKQNTEEKRP